MAEKTLKSRIVHKHDIEVNWKLATNFSPLQGEIIIYDPDENNINHRVKIGDGTTNVNDLPFLLDNKLLQSDVITNDEIDEICNAIIYDQSEVQV